MKIWKYRVAVGAFTLDMPADARILCVQMQGDQATLWAIVEPESPPVVRRFVVVGTGHVMPPGELAYIGTFQMYDGQLVWHLFEAVAS